MEMTLTTLLPVPYFCINTQNAHRKSILEVIHTVLLAVMERNRKIQVLNILRSCTV